MVRSNTPHNIKLNNNNNEPFSPLFKTAVRRTHRGRCSSSMGPNQGRTSVTRRSLFSHLIPLISVHAHVSNIRCHDPATTTQVNSIWGLRPFGSANIRAIWRPCCIMIKSQLMKRFGRSHNEGGLRWHSRNQHWSTTLWRHFQTIEICNSISLNGKGGRLNFYQS